MNGSITQPYGRKWPVRGPLMAGFIGLALLVGGFGGWAVMASIKGAIISSGRIEVDQNRQVVQHLDGGVVADILVQEGDLVAAGDLLIKLDPETILSEIAVIEGQLFEILARRARFEAERDSAQALEFSGLLLTTQNGVAQELMDGQRRLYAARIVSEGQVAEQLARRRDQIISQIEGINAQEQALETQSGLIAQELEGQKSLFERGLAQAARVLALEREEASLLGQAGELTASAAQAAGRITEIDIEIIRLESARREEAITSLRDLQYNEIELAERRRALLSRRERLDIRAPTSGVIYNMQVFARRSVIRPADPVLFIVPQDRPLIITTQVLPSDRDQIFVGQTANLRFSAFDQRRTPELAGTVVQISADAFTDEASGLSYYRAELALLEGELDRLPPEMVLVPGMPVEAFIATQTRSPMDYFIKPFADYFAKAFRET